MGHENNPDFNVDLSNASSPRALGEAEASWFGSMGEELAPGENRYVPYTGGRMALVRLKTGTLGLVDLYQKGETPPEDVAKTERVAKSAPTKPVEAKLDPDTAALFRERTAHLTTGQSIVLDGGATIRKAVDGSLWMTA